MGVRQSRWLCPDKEGAMVEIRKIITTREVVFSELRVEA
jgi:hypothetical protein